MSCHITYPLQQCFSRSVFVLFSILVTSFITILYRSHRIDGGFQHQLLSSFCVASWTVTVTGTIRLRGRWCGHLKGFGQEIIKDTHSTLFKQIFFPPRFLLKVPSDCTDEIRTQIATTRTIGSIVQDLN